MVYLRTILPAVQTICSLPFRILHSSLVPMASGGHPATREGPDESRQNDQLVTGHHVRGEIGGARPQDPSRPEKQNPHGTDV